IYPQARHPFLYYIWFEYSITRILKKINADIFISTDGYISLSTKIPTFNVIHDINFIHYPKNIPFILRKYYNYFFPKFAKKSSQIATVSEYSKNDIVKNFNIDKSKIDVVYNGANTIFKPISENEKIEFKNKYSSGKDYFLFVGALNPRKNITNLLKAFDLFKKETDSEIKLIIVGEKMFKTKTISRTYKNMTCKNEVIFSGRMSPSELKKAYGAALALSFVPYFEGFGIPIIEAMNCNTPVITSNVTSMPEIGKDAVLQTNPFSVEEIKNALIKIYSDGNLRNKLITKGQKRKNDFTWDKTANKLWHSIEKILPKETN
ncbi:MAG: glycosyltransferase family 1 protein, partial [Bacteroidota bacterium]|nr:glycosyltransferase family 1 protein [Bacteroidota bacterium]